MMQSMDNISREREGNDGMKTPESRQRQTGDGCRDTFNLGVTECIGTWWVRYIYLT